MVYGSAKEARNEMLFFIRICNLGSKSFTFKKLELT